AARAEQAGIDPARICLDPGIGFGKLLEHNLALLAHLGALVETGYPVLVGTSRKSFLGQILDGLPPAEREEGTAATLALAVERGATAVRVHDVVMARRVTRVADAIVRAAERERAWRA
ncbi:MAG: dihydropteroate synthase, partial [Acidimicrobiia bacterium]